MNDPKSYEPVKFSGIDTVYFIDKFKSDVQFYTDIIGRDSARLLKTVLTNFDKQTITESMNRFKVGLDSVTNAYNQNKDNHSITAYRISHTFRARIKQVV